MLTKRSTEVLNLMQEAELREDYDAAEIVCSGIECWLGDTRISRKTVNDLLRHVAVSQASEPGSLERYTISGTGKAILQDPSAADRVAAALLSGTNVDAAGRPI